jgi:hypothetical protein
MTLTSLLSPHPNRGGADKTTKKTASKKRVSKQAGIQLEEPSDSEESSSSASSEDDNHDNVDVSDLEMVDVAFMTDVPNNEVTQRQRLAFNVRAFGYNSISDIFPTPPKSSTQFTNEKFSETLDIMRQIQSDDVDAKKKVKASKLNYKKAHQFELQEIHLTNGNNKTLLCRKAELVKPLLWGPRGNIVLPMRQMFDVLYSAHERVGHMKVVSTYKNLQKIIWNVTLAQSKAFFCALSPNCALQSPKVRSLQGASRPIRSSNFRDRFQVDLVDMSANRRQTIYGIVMRYIVVMKDHFSGFAMTDCIPRKCANFVAHVINHFFSIIGYPSIFHTENGKEFTAKCILDLLCS